MTVSLEINVEDARWGDLEPLARRAADMVLVHLGHDPAFFELSILACSDARIRQLNESFRGKDAATNVLSWPAWDLSPEIPGALPEAPEPGTADDPEPLGDIALAWETCQREALEQGKRPADHVTHLTVHSILHCLGYDHETDADAALMEETEVTILAKLGIGDPYAWHEVSRPAGVAGLD